MKKMLKLLIILTMVYFCMQTLSFAELEKENARIKETIAKLVIGLNKYKIVNNTYPEDENINLVLALRPDYVIFSAQEIKDGLLLDPWGRPYIYQRYDFGDNLRWHTYEIYSVGPNGVDEEGNGDDVGNW